jgi:hypothetical protein
MIVKTLSISLTMLIISGCGQVRFSNCVTPDVKKPNIDRIKKDNIYDSSKQCLSNYYKMKSYAEQLEEANGVCK